MSILWAFEKMLAEPARVERELRELRKDVEARDEDAAAPPELQCRACRYVGQEPYCPRCLSDTMRPVRRRPPESL